MTSSNPSSRSPSRTTTRSQQSNTPGVLAISSALLANAGQSQSGQSAGQGKRSKSSNQRRAEKASNTTLFDPSSPASSPAVTRTDKRPDPASASAAATTAEASADTAAPPTDSPSKRTRSRRRARPLQSASDADEGIDVSTVDSPSALSANASRPRQGRGLSSINFALTSSEQLDDNVNSPSLARGKADPSTLSKSAPASSFLEGIQQSRQRRGDSNHHRKEDSQSVHHPNIRSSNSADEWEMPSARLLTGNDSLTWQQQAALSRKSSQQSKKSNKSKLPAADANQFKKQTPAPAQRATPTEATAPRSALSNAMAAGAAAAEQKAPSSALTWQQALLQRSAPATPASNIFEALEDGYSGARPASDHSRTRSSPVKNSRPVTRSQQQQQHQPVPLKPTTAPEPEVDLDKQLKDLILSSVKPAKPAQPKSSKKAKPISIQATTPADDVSRDLFGPSTAPSAISGSLATSKPIPMSGNSVSPTKSALYAGPKFHNSPHATQLPTPRLAAFMNRNRESSPAAQSPSSNEPIFA